MILSNKQFGGYKSYIKQVTGTTLKAKVFERKNLMFKMKFISYPK